MDTSKLNLTSLKDKISSKINLLSLKKNKKETKVKKQKEQTQEKAQESKKLSSKDSKHSKSTQEEPVESEQDILRREALALGATEEDLALLNGVEEGEESEQEFDSNDGKVDKSFGDDLSQFMKGIGLGSGEAIVIDDDEVEPELVEE